MKKETDVYVQPKEMFRINRWKLRMIFAYANHMHQFLDNILEKAMYIHLY